ncbi:hypothetical protein CSOJ01_09985 [Colletotrichum sojae]|uniref:Uncharacterized protein n=1 Tax=Colletotrichum sojae TaxID=2175907 RepID=A0A8H6J244_9PEZI|nr:hypothetical protein CSOJ01_09985 [Colletotrichum sojae]
MIPPTLPQRLVFIRVSPAPDRSNTINMLNHQLPGLSTSSTATIRVLAEHLNGRTALAIRVSAMTSAVIRDWLARHRGW